MISVNFHRSPGGPAQCRTSPSLVQDRRCQRSAGRNASVAKSRHAVRSIQAGRPTPVVTFPFSGPGTALEEHRNRIRR